MRPAHPAVGLLFGVGVALLITLTGPLLLFNPWFVGFEQDRHGVPSLLGTTDAEVDRVTAAILGDLLFDGTFAVALDGEEPLLDARERSHMDDVSRLVRLLWAVLGVSAGVTVLTHHRLRAEHRRVGRILLSSAAGVGIAALMLALIFAVAFEPAFLAFHAIFFPAGTYLFAPGSDLIRLFPGGFWFEVTLVAGATIVLAAGLVSLIGWRLARRSPA